MLLSFFGSDPLSDNHAGTVYGEKTAPQPAADQHVDNRQRVSEDSVGSALGIGPSIRRRFAGDPVKRVARFVLKLTMG
jgi:hypothetical protein